MSVTDRLAALSPDQRALFEKLRERQRKAARTHQPAPPILAVPRDRELPLSFAQQRLWLLDQIEPGNPAYNVPLALRLVGEIEPTLLTSIFSEIIRRHESLRTTFASREDGPVQVIASPEPLDLPLLDLSHLPEKERDFQARDLAFAEARHPFNLRRGPLLRLLLVRLGERSHLLLLTMHHIVADGWSMGIMVREITALYTAFAEGRPSPLPELPVQYADFAVWQRAWLRDTVLEEQLDWWKPQLAETPAPLELPMESSRPAVLTSRGEAAERLLSPELCRQIEELGRREGTTPFITLLAALSALLHRYTGQDDMVVGTPIAGRTRAETESLIGFFVNTLALRIDLSGDPTARELLGRVRDTTLGSSDHQEVPFDLLLEEIRPERDLSRTPLFQIVLNWLGFGAGHELVELPGLILEQLPEISPSAKVDLEIYASPRAGQIFLRAVYNRDLFASFQIEDLLTHLETILAGMAAGAERRLSELPPTIEPREVRRSPIAASGSGFLIEALDCSIPERFAALASVHASRPAVVTPGGTWTYAELACKVNGVAHALLARCHARGERIALLFSPGLSMVASVLGALAAGATYVPLDPSHPRERLLDVLADCNATVLLVGDDQRVRAEEIRSGLPVLFFGDLPQVSTGWTPPQAAPEDLAYLLYTSGSTGRPKGVLQNHRNVLGHIRTYSLRLGLGPEDRLLLLARYGFDAAVMDLYGALLNGATLCIWDLKKDGLERLGRWIAEQAVTVYHSTPSVYRALLDSLQPGESWPDLRLVVLGGEEARRQDFERFREAFPSGSYLVNGLGPTESTLALQRFLDRDERITRAGLPIGWPVEEVRVRLRQGGGEQPTIWGVGEIEICSSYLAVGYWGQPDLTAERFVPDPEGLAGSRLYRTGDLARRLPEGDLEFLGRIDGQVKVRGYRIETGEIEAALVAQAGVRQAVVVAREARFGPGPSDRRLVAYVVGEIAVDVLRSSLQGRLPDYMVPAAFVMLPALPLTPNGKVDRSALPSPEWQYHEETYLAPRSPLEEVLAGIWAGLLGCERVGATDDFFGLGGHSLLATQVMSRLRSAFDVEMPLRDLFEAPKLKDFATRVEMALGTRGAPAAPPLIPVPRRGPLPLSFAQQRLWFLDQLEPGRAVYNMPVALRVEGTLDHAVLASCFSEIVRRHEVLRTVFSQREGEPVQVAQPAVPFRLALIDLSELSESNREATALALTAEETGRPFNLAKGPLLRCLLLRLTDVDHIATLTLHHIVSDGWSMGILIREVVALYAAFAEGGPSPLPELPVQYADYAVWQRSWLQGEVLEAQLDHWKRRLAGAPTVLELPIDRPRPSVQSFRGATRALPLGHAFSEAVRELCRREGTTPFMALLATWAALLGRHTGQPDVLVGSPIAGRNRQEIEGLIGFFANTLVMRSDLSGNPSFGELLSRVRRSSLDAFAHQDLPFERIVEEVVDERNMALSPLFQVLFVLQNAPRGNLAVPGLELSPVDLRAGLAKFDLSLVLVDGENGLWGALEFATDLFDVATVDRLGAQFRNLLESAMADPRRRLAELPLLPESELHQILREWNDVPSQDHSVYVHHLVEAQARRRPEATATLTSDGSEISYGQLDRMASRLAFTLSTLGVRPDDRVGVYLDRSWEGGVALLAILKAGGCYLPLDPAYPHDRLEFMLTDARAPVIVTRTELVTGLLLHGVRILALDGFWEEGDQSHGGGGGGALPMIGPDHLSYIIYTSGSTGRPKGVALPHSTLANLIAWQIAASAAPRGRTLQFASPSFDVSLQETLATWAAGGTLVLIAEEERRDAEALLRRLREARVERLFLPFVALQQLAEAALCATSLPSLREVVTAGEQLQITPEVRAFFSRLPGCVLRNQYGPSETHVVTEASLWNQRPGEVEEWPTLPSIGLPIAATEVHLLDLEGVPVPIGVSGEIYLGGEGVARGYLGRPELTAARFVPHPWGRQGGRLYRTGDLARRRPSGEIEFLGRIDHQVKIRGFRIELGEIEASLATHPDVREAVVVVRGEGTARRLVACVVATEGVQDLNGALRVHLRDRLPDYMVPATFVPVESFPLTPSGKVDRRALALSCSESRQDLSGHVPPGTPIEELMAGIWGEVLGIERMGIHESFFALGGHSLLATQVISRIRSLFGTELPLRQLFESPTIAELARAVQEAGSNVQAPPILPVPRDHDLPASFAQQRLWFIDQLEPGRPLYNIPVALRVEGPMDLRVLTLTLSEIVRRHEVLRTVFAAPEGSPVQVIQLAAPFLLNVVDLSELPERAREALIPTLTRGEAGRPFDLARGPLLRGMLLRLAEDDHVVALTMHHIVSDGWSIGILVRELMALYAAFVEGRPSTLPELPIQYADFAVWQRSWMQGGILEAQLEYWRRQLAEAPVVLEVPLDRPRPAVQTFRGATRPFQINPGLSDAVRGLCRREGVTPFMALLAAWAVLLGRHAGQDDVLVGAPTAGRRNRETEGLIGFFVNTLVLRLDLSENSTFGELLDRVRQTALDAFTHQDLPFERIVEELGVERNLAFSPLFQVLFVLQNAPATELAVSGLAIAPIAVDPGVAKFDLSLILQEVSAGFLGTLEHNADLFNRDTVERLLARFVALLEAAVQDPSLPVADLPILLPRERQQVLWEWSGEATSYPREATIHVLLAEQAALTPDAVAVVGAGESLSYVELERRAGRWARRLCALGVGLEVRVGICLDRSPARVVMTLAVLMAGGAYVPLDPTYPRERLAFLVRDSGASVLVTEERWLTTLPQNAATVLCLDQDDPGEESFIKPIGARQVPATALAYVMYTSGSTGEPKGVAVTHRSVVRLVRETSYARFGPDEVFLQIAPYAFDASTLELWGALLNGGRLVMPPPGVLSPADLGEVLRDHGVTALWLTAGLFHQMVDENLQGLSKVRQLLAGGDVLSVSHARRVLAELPGTRLINGYGPTENTTFTCCYPVSDSASLEPSVPLGRPIANTWVSVLDRNLALVPVGVTGELYAGGDGLARGYLGRPALTAERFLPDPFRKDAGGRLYRTGDLARWRSTGELEYLGRIDAQVKVRGFRVEPAEIEVALSAHPWVRQAVVLAEGQSAAERRLVCYVVGAAGEVPDPSELRSFLRERMPDFMLPAAWVFLSELPLTAQGKVDRRALEKLRPERIVPAREARHRTPAEELLAGIFAEVLQVEHVGVHESFFDRGGHSLLATRVISRVRETFGVELPLRELFDAPTVAELAERVQKTRSSGRALLPPIEPARRNGDLPLSFAQARLWFLDQLQAGGSAYNIPAAFLLTGHLDLGALHGSFYTILQRHESLRTTFPTVDGQPVQRISHSPDFCLPVVDLTGLTGGLRNAVVSTLIASELQCTFDLVLGPLLRCLLLRLQDREHLLLLNMHHIVSDGWSMGVLVREMCALYPALRLGRTAPLAELPIQYPDFAVWQRSWLQGEVLEAQMSYWRERLRGIPAVLELPTDRPRPAVQTFAGTSLAFALPEDLSARLNVLSRHVGATLFMTLLSTFQEILGRSCGRTDLAVGTPVAGRTHLQTENLIGFFVNMLVVRADLSGEPSFTRLSERIRETLLSAYAHQDLPFEMLVEEVLPERSLSHTPLFQVVFALQNTPFQALGVEPLSLRPVPLETGTAKFDLTVSAQETEGGLVGAVEYNKDLFDGATVQRLIRHWEVLLAGVVASPELRMSDLEWMTPEERAQLLREWNDTSRPHLQSPMVHELFAQHAALHPEAVAVTSSEGRLSYGEVEGRANRLAWHLRDLGVGPDVLVAICMERTLLRVVGIVAVLKAGGAYVSLDPAYPDDRLAFMLEDAGAPVLLTEERSAGRPPRSLARERVLFLDADWESIQGEESAVPESGVGPQHLAYMIYTSGSTGRPKGVEIPHAGLMNLVRWHQILYAVCPEDRATLIASPAFDASIWELWPYLAAGASVHIPEEEARLSSPGMVRWLAEQEITLAFLMTPLAEGVLEERLPADLKLRLRALITGGDRLHRGPDPQAGYRLMNHYGPAENAVVSSVIEVPPRDRWIGLPTIGRAIDNTRIYVLDSWLRPVPVGIPGELCVTGLGLARGYHERPDLTAEKLVPDPFSVEPGGRMYRTADRVRWLPNGEIDFLGRQDHQVKIRGVRVELGEIEAVLGRYAGVRDVSVSLWESPAGKRLVAHVVYAGEPRPKPEEMRAFLSERLPEQMVPTTFVALGTLPLTPNGKVDRRALPAPDWGEAVSFTLPGTPAEEVLVGLFAETLGLERVGVEDDFFSLGGHSLLATRLVSRLREVFGRELPLRAIFEAPTVAKLAERIESLHERPSLPPILPAPRDRDLPLSFAQQRLWLVDQIEPGNPAYNIPFVLRLVGEIEPGLLERIFSEITRRHEALRTTFTSRGDEPMQVIAPPQPVELPILDLSCLTDSERAAQARELSSVEARTSFDLRSGPLMRSLLVRLGATDHLLLLTMHHIVSDGWSMGAFLREVAALYEAFSQGHPSPLTELPVQYADFALWQRSWLQSKILKEQLDYWRRQLDGAPALLELPLDRPRPAAQTYRGARGPVVLPSPLSEAIGRLCRRKGVTPFMALLAAWAVLLGRHAGQDDVLTGAPIAGRNQRELEGLIGFFINTLVLRSDLSGNPSLGELLDRVRRTALDAFTYQNLPFERLVEDLAPERSLAHSPLFQVMFVLQNLPNGDLTIPGLVLSPVDVDTGSAKLDLSLTLSESPAGFVGALTYAMDLFDRSTAERLIAGFKTVLAGLTSADLQQPLQDLEVLSENERQQLLVDWSTEDSRISNSSIYELFEQQAQRTPDAVAVIFEEERWTYRDLLRRSRLIASFLREQGVGSSDRVAILDQRSAERVARILGVLSSGAAYVAVDREQPRARRAEILADVAPVWIFPPQPPLPLAREEEISAGERFLPEISARDAFEESSKGSKVCLGPAYVVYTSGSTGRPKGILAHHRGGATYLEWVIRNYRLSESDVALQLAPLTFDASLRDTLAPLAAGGQIVIVPDDLARDPAALLERMEAHGVTCLPSIVPSLLRLLIEEALASGRRVASLRLILASGEKLHGADVAAVRKAFGEKVCLVNQYGASEATMSSTWYATTADDEVRPALPAGRPAASTRVFLLDRALRPVPLGAVGEICFGGPGLTFGYLGQPDRTAEVFIPDPFGALGERLYRTGDRGRYRPDGVLELLGRIDFQVKIRGQRVEPGEVESVLRSHPAVRQAVVAARGEDEPRLTAWLAADGVESGGLRAFLAERLPAPMIPSDWVFLDTLPLTPHGKIDRSRLPEPSREHATIQEPRDRTELRLVRLWEEILGLQPVGISDNFFTLGGHSLSAVRLMAGIRRLFGRDLPLSELFRRPTIESLAETLRYGDQGRPWSPLVALTPGRAGEVPLFCLHGGDGHALTFANLARALSAAGEDRPVFALEACGLCGGQTPLESIEELARLYLDAVRKVWPQGPYRLLGYSMGSKVAFEMARRLEREGEIVERLIFLDIPALPRAEAIRDLEVPAEVRVLPGFDPELADRYLAVQKANLKASHTWTPEPFGGKALLIVAEEGSYAGGADPTLGWGGVVQGGVEIASTPGDHFSLLRPPHVQTLVERILRSGGADPHLRRNSEDGSACVAL